MAAQQPLECLPLSISNQPKPVVDGLDVKDCFWPKSGLATCERSTAKLTFGAVHWASGLGQAFNDSGRRQSLQRRPSDSLHVEPIGLLTVVRSDSHLVLLTLFNAGHPSSGLGCISASKTFLLRLSWLP